MISASICVVRMHQLPEDYRMVSFMDFLGLMAIGVKDGNIMNIPGQLLEQSVFNTNLIKLTHIIGRLFTV